MIGTGRSTSHVVDELLDLRGTVVLTELRDRVAIIKEQLDSLEMSRGEQAVHAIAVFELSQRLTYKWLTADYTAERQILDIVFPNSRLDGVSLCCEMRKPFALLAEGLLVSKQRRG